MLEAWQRRRKLLRERTGLASVAVPFVPAARERIASATARLDDLIGRPGAIARAALPERPIIPPKPRLLWER